MLISLNKIKNMNRLNLDVSNLENKKIVNDTRLYALF